MKMVDLSKAMLNYQRVVSVKMCLPFGNPILPATPPLKRLDRIPLKPPLMGLFIAMFDDQGVYFLDPLPIVLVHQMWGRRFCHMYLYVFLENT